MTDRHPPADKLAEEREEVGLDAGSVARPAAAQAAGAFALPEEPTGVPSDLTLTYEAGVELKARSQWAYVRIRFFRHRLAVASLVVLILIALVAVFARQLAPYRFDELDLDNIGSPPTLEGKHWFGTDFLGRDYLSRVIYGVRTSLWVAMFVALLSTAIGTARA